MAWCDKIALGLFGIIMAVFLLGSLMSGGASRIGPEWFEAFLNIGWHMALVTLPVWIVLRILDWMIGGPARRRGRFIVQRAD